MSGALTFRFTTQAQADIRRVTSELSDLQRQIASGSKYKDLMGFGGGASRLLNAQSLKSNADSRISVITQLQARFGMQAAALGQVSNGARMLAQAIREGIAGNDGRGVSTELELSFKSVVSALNETWNGQPLFAGERQGAGPIKINTLDELAAATGPQDIFDEAARHQILDLGVGEPIMISAKASDISQGLLQTLSDMKDFLDANGGTIGQPITAAQLTMLQHFADRLDVEATKFTTEEGRAGQLQKRFDTERTRLEERSNLLVKEIGDQADADIGAVSVRLSSLMLQYEASAKTFSELSKLSLLDYL